MRISQLVERSGVPATTLRYYESRGLLPARRSESGYRLYGQDAVERLAFINAGKRLGVSLNEIAELLKVWRDGTCAQVKASLRPRLARHVTAARVRAEEVSSFISTLRGALDHLDSLPDRSGPCTPECGVLDLAKRRSARAAPPVPGPLRQSPPVACSLGTDGTRERVDQWRALLRGSHHETVPSGRRVSLPADRAADAAALAAAEQRCCPFFSFTLDFDHTVVHLEARVPDEAQQILIYLFDATDTAPDPRRTPTC